MFNLSSLLYDLLNIYKVILIASVIMFWLVRYNIVDYKNDIMRNLGNFLTRATEPVLAPIPAKPVKDSLGEVLKPPYRSRLIMLIVFNLCQVIGYYGFANWVPSLLIAQGIGVTQSLAYSAVIAIANPIGPLIGMSFADRVDRKWVIVGAALTVAVVGTAFAQFTDPASLIVCGMLANKLLRRRT